MTLRTFVVGILFLVAGCSRNLERACAEGESGSASAADAPSPRAGYLLFAHAHNDYEHDQPLMDALARGFHSVEADIYLHNGDLLISHAGFSFKGSLRELYLEPLQRLVKSHGNSVFGDGEPFHLWVDIKDGDPKLREVLRRQLAAFPMLTEFTDSVIKPGPVTVVLTGDEGAKTAFVEESAVRRATRDSNHYSPNDPPADNRWRYYALRYSDYIRWGGDGLPDADSLRRLRCIMADAHRKGRKVRLFGAPEEPGYWKTALATGVDFISTDLLDALRSALTGNIAVPAEAPSSSPGSLVPHQPPPA